MFVLGIWHCLDSRVRGAVGATFIFRKTELCCLVIIVVESHVGILVILNTTRTAPSSRFHQRSFAFCQQLMGNKSTCLHSKIYFLLIRKKQRQESLHMCFGVKSASLSSRGWAPSSSSWQDGSRSSSNTFSHDDGQKEKRGSFLP